MRRCVREDGHYRVVDTLGIMLRNGTIDVPMHDAGHRFAEDFHKASLHGIRAVNLASMGGGSSSGESMTEITAHARLRAHKALDAVGGIGSPGGSALWDVVGLGKSLREWAATGWKGKTMKPHEASGILVATLGTLARHYAYDFSPRKMLTPVPTQRRRSS